MATTNPLQRVTTLTFDIFGTVLDLGGSLTPSIQEYLAGQNADLDGDEFWAQWRVRQRLEQWQDSLLMVGHSGYLATCRRSLIHTLKANGIDHTDRDVGRLMLAWESLRPYNDALEGLRRLRSRYRLVALSNGDRPYLERLVENNIGFPFAAVVSVDDVEVFKPHPAVYRSAAAKLDCEPGEIMMVAAHGFDIVGARACGYRGAYVDRYGLPFDESPYQPDLIVDDFIELADRLTGA